MKKITAIITFVALSIFSMSSYASYTNAQINITGIGSDEEFQTYNTNNPTGGDVTFTQIAPTKFEVKSNSEGEGSGLLSIFVQAKSVLKECRVRIWGKDQLHHPNTLWNAAPYNQTNCSATVTHSGSKYLITIHIK